MRRRISLWGRVRPSVRRSVRPSVPCYFQTRTRRILCRVSGLVLFKTYLIPVITEFYNLIVALSTWLMPYQNFLKKIFSHSFCSLCYLSSFNCGMRSREVERKHWKRIVSLEGGERIGAQRAILWNDNFFYLSYWITTFCSASLMCS